MRRAKVDAPAEWVPPSTPEGGSIVQPVATGGAPAEAAPAPTIQEQENVLRRRLQEQDNAERIQQEAFAAQQAAQAQIRANLDVAGPNDERPPSKLSERDLQWLGQRPGVEHDPEFLTMAQNTPGYGTDRYYDILSYAFPAKRYRRVEPAPQPQPAPQMATEKRAADLTDEE